MRELTLTSGTISVRVGRFQRAGSAGPDPNARRSVPVRLTKHRPRTFDRAAPAHLASQERPLPALGAEQREVLAGLLGRLLLAFQSRVTAAAPVGAAVGLPGITGVPVTDIVRGCPPASPLALPAPAPPARGSAELGDASGIALRSPTALLDAIAAACASGLLRPEVVRGTPRRRVEVPETGGPAPAARTARGATDTTTQPPGRGPRSARARPPVLCRLPEVTSPPAPMSRRGQRP